MFGKEDSHSEILQSLLREICNVTLVTCHCNMSEYTDILEAFFLLLSQILKKNSHMFSNNAVDVTALFQCGKFSFLKIMCSRKFRDVLV